MTVCFGLAVLRGHLSFGVRKSVQIEQWQLHLKGDSATEMMNVAVAMFGCESAMPGSSESCFIEGCGWQSQHGMTGVMYHRMHIQFVVTGMLFI